MDKVYRVFQKGQAPETGEKVTGLKLKSIITQPLPETSHNAGPIVILGAAYAGEARVAAVEVTTDGGATWQAAEFIGPNEPFAWRQWQFRWEVDAPGRYVIMSRAVDEQGYRQPEKAEWNVLGYGNNGIAEHAVKITVAP